MINILSKKTISLYIIFFFQLSGITIFGKDFNDAEVNRAVIQLGINTNINEMIQIKEFHQYAHKVAPLLIKELEIINPPFSEILEDDLFKSDKKAWHVFWCIRALQSLTGKIFEAYTQETKTYPIQKYLQIKNPLPFFIIHMSTDSLYIGPKDVQQKIIDQWKKYIQQNPDFKVRKYNFGSDDNWFFGWLKNYGSNHDETIIIPENKEEGK